MSVFVPGIQRDHPLWPCPHCRKRFKRNQRVGHLRGVVIAEGKTICVGMKNHPRHAANEKHKKAIG